MLRTLVMLLVLAVAPLPARAQSSSSSHAATARSLFQEGVGLARRGEYAEATDRFRRAQALHPAAPVAYNLASALVHTGALVEASEVIEGLLRDPSLTDALRTAGEHLRAQITPRISRLTVRLSGDARGVTVELDAHALPDAAIGVTMPVDPGAHEIRAVRDGEQAARERVELSDGEARELVLDVAPRALPTPEVPRAAIEVTTAAPATTTDTAPASGGDDGVWIGVGIGVAVLAVGAIATTVGVLTTPGAGAPVSGNAMPGVLTW